MKASNQIALLIDEECFELKDLVQSLQETAMDLRVELAGPGENKEGLEEGIAIIDNLIDLLRGVADLNSLEVHHGMAILAHLTLLNEYIDMMDPCEEEFVKKYKTF